MSAAELHRGTPLLSRSLRRGGSCINIFGVLLQPLISGTSLTFGDAHKQSPQTWSLKIKMQFLSAFCAISLAPST